MGVALLGILLAGLYSGITFAVQEIRSARQSERATQILASKMEVVRLFNWSQVTSLAGYIPTSFTEPYYASNPTNSSGSSFNYTGTVSVTSAPLTETYSNDLRMIQITLTWTTGNVTRTKTMSTFVSQYGMQNYNH